MSAAVHAFDATVSSYSRRRWASRNYFAEAEVEEPKSRSWPEGWRHHYQGISRAFVALLFCLL